MKFLYCHCRGLLTNGDDDCKKFVCFFPIFKLKTKVIDIMASAQN